MKMGKKILGGLVLLLPLISLAGASSSLHTGTFHTDEMQALCPGTRPFLAISAMLLVFASGTALALSWVLGMFKKTAGFQPYLDKGAKAAAVVAAFLIVIYLLVPVLLSLLIKTGPSQLTGCW